MRTCGCNSRPVCVSFTAISTTTPPTIGSRRRSQNSTNHAAPVATTRSICRSRPRPSTWCARNSPITTLRTATAARAGGAWSSRSPSGTTWNRPANSTRSWNGCSPRTACSASTTTWARKRFRTSWPYVSRIKCSSRYGTPVTWTTCRSPWPRTSASDRAPVTTTVWVPPAT